MDLNQIKSKLQQLNNTNQEREKVDYTTLFWRPTLGKHNVRIVPSAFNKSFPFTELKFHNLTKYPIIALSNFGEQDPVEDFIKELRKTSDKDNWSLSGKISPRTRVFAPVIVRGEEDKGVRLWGFGTTIYKALLALAEDEDIGDYTDISNGYDMVVEQVAGQPFNTTTVRIKPKTSPLSTDNTLVEKWLTNQPEPTESFTKYDFEFIKDKLEEYLNPVAQSAPAEPESNYASTPLESLTEGERKNSKFASLFETKTNEQ